MDWSKFLSTVFSPGKGLTFSNLIRLSDFSPTEIDDFRQAWVDVEEDRRYKLIARLAELAEENVEVNFDAVFRLGLGDEEPKVRLKAIEGLSESEDPTLIPPLLQILHEDKEASIQAAAATALGKFVLLVELNKLHTRQAMALADELLSVINQAEKPVEVRRRALEAIAALSQPRVSAEIERAYHSQELALKLGSIYAMGQNCDPRWLKLLIKELSSPLQEMRYEAAVACGKMGEQEVVPNLIPLLNDEDTELQIATVQSLGKIGGPQAKAVLRRLAQKRDSTIQELAQEALEELLAEESLGEI